MNIRFVDINEDRSHLADIRALYDSAFPEDERAPFSVLIRGAKKGNVDFWSCTDSDEWVGLLYVVSLDDMSYIFYFAVDEHKRGKGYGTAILRAAQEVYEGHRLFLAIEEVDPKYDNYSERVKRQRFYENAGFALSGQKMQEADTIYDLMKIGGPVTNREYRRLMRSFMGLRMLYIPLKILEDQQADPFRT